MNGLRRITPRLDITVSAYKKLMDLSDLLIIDIQSHLMTMIPRLVQLRVNNNKKNAPENNNKLIQQNARLFQLAAVGGV